MNYFVKTLLAASLFCVTLFAFAANPAVSSAEKEKIQQVVQQYLLEKPEVIVQAIQNFQRKQYEQAEATIKNTQKNVSSYAKPLFHNTNDPIAGNPDGKVTIVEFFDYQCPHCVDMAAIIDSIIKANPDVRVVFKEFPIRGAASDLAARAALAANLQGKYYSFSHALLTANQPLTEEIIFKVAKDNGIDVDKLKTDMSNKNISEQIKSNIKLAQELKLFGTPAFFIGKTASDVINYSPGQIDQKQMQSIIDKSKS